MKVRNTRLRQGGVREIFMFMTRRQELEKEYPSHHYTSLRVGFKNGVNPVEVEKKHTEGQAPILVASSQLALHSPDEASFSPTLHERPKKGVHRILQKIGYLASVAIRLHGLGCILYFFHYRSSRGFIFCHNSSQRFVWLF